MSAPRKNSSIPGGTIEAQARFLLNRTVAELEEMRATLPTSPPIGSQEWADADFIRLALKQRRAPPKGEEHRRNEKEWAAAAVRASDDEAAFRRAWAPAELKELRGPEHGNERVAPICERDGDEP